MRLVRISRQCTWYMSLALHNQVCTTPYLYVYGAQPKNPAEDRPCQELPGQYRQYTPPP